MDIKQLEKIKQHYDVIVSDYKKLEGEEKQLQLERERLVKALKDAGFNDKAELDRKLSELSGEMEQIDSEINSILKTVQENYIGIEQDKEYCGIAESRIGTVDSSQLELF